MNERPEADVRRRNRRKTTLVDPSFQLRFAARLGGALIVFLLPYVVIAFATPALVKWQGDADATLLDETSRQITTMLRVAFVPLTTTLVMMFLYGVRESFRIAGPSYKFRRTFEGLESRAIQPGVKVRRGDYLTDTAASLDRALGLLHRDIGSWQEAARRAAQQVDDLRRGESGAQGLDALAAEVHQLREGLDRWKLSSPDTSAPQMRDGPASPAVGMDVKVDAEQEVAAIQAQG